MLQEDLDRIVLDLQREQNQTKRIQKQLDRQASTNKELANNLKHIPSVTIQSLKEDEAIKTLHKSQGLTNEKLVCFRLSRPSY